VAEAMHFPLPSSSSCVVYLFVCGGRKKKRKKESTKQLQLSFYEKPEEARTRED